MSAQSEIVKELYQGILQREPDNGGLSTYVRRLDNQDITIPQIAIGMVHSDEFLRNFSNLATKSGAKYPLLNSVTQYDELFQLFGAVLKAHFGEPYVVDCGARGRERSNSYDLMRFFGWKGLLIEANPRLIPGIKSEFFGLNCVIVECAVSDVAGRATFTIGVNDDVSSLDGGMAAAWGETKGQIAVEMRRLPDILRENRVPQNFGLLSLDIEGQDILVMNDLIDNSDYRPQYVIIEASFDFQTKSLHELPLSDRVRSIYEIVGQTQANLILQRRR